MSIVDILRRTPEPFPEWLAGEKPPKFDRRAFFGSRTVYYPGSGNDSQPVKLCSRAHAAHAFVYVDYRVEWEDLAERLRDPAQGFRGYAVTHTEDVSENILRPTDRLPHARSSVTPFARFAVLDRRNGGEDHGPQRLAILLIGVDGIASYGSLYCQEDGTRNPFLVVIQDHGFGGNYDKFGRGGLLARNVLKCRVWPEYLLVGDNTEPWLGYEDTGAAEEPGGMHAHPRRLFYRSSEGARPSASG